MHCPVPTVVSFWTFISVAFDGTWSKQGCSRLIYKKRQIICLVLLYLGLSAYCMGNKLYGGRVEGSECE